MDVLERSMSYLTLFLYWSTLTSIYVHGDDVENSETSASDTRLAPPAQIVQVADNIWVAIGYALGNSIMIEGDDGIIIVDVTETIESAQAILSDFRNITSKPIKALVYTHNHMDHTFGAQGFIEDPANPPDIYAHSKLIDELQRVFFVNPMWSQRGARQFGIYLAEGELQHGQAGFLYPNKIFSNDQREINVAGIKITLMHTPGETKDMIGVWLEKEKIFLSGDNLYKAFPNLYSIRGTPSRSTVQWAASIDKVLDLQPKVLISSHLMPIHGWPKIKSILTPYRDAIQFVHDQTIRFMNKGLLPDEIVDVIELPSQLASHPYLVERYGTVHWSVKGVFNTYIGWFSGDPVDLTPLKPNEEAKRMVEFGGGVEKTVEKADEASRNQDYQWALKLSSSVLRVMPSNSQARSIKSDALDKLAKTQTSVNGIFYYKSCAAETRGEIDTKTKLSSLKAFALQGSLWHLFNTLRVYFKTEVCQEFDVSVGFKIFSRDTILYIRLHIRNGIVVVTESDPITHHGSHDVADHHIVCSESQCRQLVTELIFGKATSLTFFDVKEGFVIEKLAKCFGQ